MDKKYEYNSPLVYQRADPFVYLHTDGYYSQVQCHSMTVLR